VNIEKTIILSDIHANILAYKAGLRQARKIGFEKLINLGDLLTYGPEPLAVIEESVNSVYHDNMIMVMGNHDKLYTDLAVGNDTYYSKLPNWIQESVDWTANTIDISNFGKIFSWQKSYSKSGVYFAHANALEFGDWSYLNNQDEINSTRSALRNKKSVIGVFGHTHRPNIINHSIQKIVSSGKIGEFVIDTEKSINDTCLIVNAGSVGQPRGIEKVSTMVVLSTKSKKILVDIVPIEYDITEHIKKIAHLGVSHEAKKNILKYY
jgi:predicted phosphodiesterase